ncbi:DUF305 domain-containing protein [Hyphococcus sp.]|uniref:DUF305 domain-containing protein n=1 Tax=Hyphococcus sp. TaxID=2038636 RepID=UPI003D14A479
MSEKNGKYLRFGAMILTSMTAMFIFMYLNTYALNHVHFSETRFYMTLIMGASMSVIMLLYMIGMYDNKILNIFILTGSVVVFIAAILLVRSQALVGDRSYMMGMIPHHSIAILTSERANIDDVRVRELADEIIRAQRREIKEMEWLIDDIAANGTAENQAEAETRPVPDFEGEV